MKAGMKTSIVEQDINCTGYARLKKRIAIPPSKWCRREESQSSLMIRLIHS